jgi:hypothetical protein
MFALVATQGGMGCPNRSGAIALPQAMRAAELAMTRPGWLDVIAAVLRRHADGLDRPDQGHGPTTRDGNMCARLP